MFNPALHTEEIILRASQNAIGILKLNVDVMIYCLIVPINFFAVSQVYENFDQVSDDEVISLLKDAKKRERNVLEPKYQNHSIRFNKI